MTPQIFVVTIADGRKPGNFGPVEVLGTNRNRRWFIFEVSYHFLAPRIRQINTNFY